MRSECANWNNKKLLEPALEIRNSRIPYTSRSSSLLVFTPKVYTRFSNEKYMCLNLKLSL